MIRILVQQKSEIWNQDRQDSYEYINDIAEYFAGNLNWERTNEVNENFSQWFRNAAELI